MAYISATEVKAIRDTLKAKFPKFKWGVRKGRGSISVKVTIKSGPTDFGMTNIQVNEYHLGNYGEHAKFFEQVIGITKTAPSTVEGGRAWFDESDAQIDYFSTAYFIHLQVGTWDKPYNVVSK